MLRSSKQGCQANRGKPTVVKLPSEREGLPCSSTPVLLTVQLLLPRMPLHELSGGSHQGESPTKGSTWDGCTFGTGSACELLDIGLIRYTVLSGFLYCLGGTPCHVNSLLYS
jgi:hypothetical protein